MPFCPQCNIEYRDGTARCADCGHELVDSLPQEPSGSKAEDASTYDYGYIDDEPAFLTSGSAQDDCMLIEGTLETAGIPFLKKNRGTGAYMKVIMGYSVFGSDYYVPSKLLAKAQKVLDSEAEATENGTDSDESEFANTELSAEEEQDFENEDGNMSTDESKSGSSRRVGAIVALCIWLGVATIFIVVLGRMIINFFNM